jgi:hypothetical protein
MKRWTTAAVMALTCMALLVPSPACGKTIHTQSTTTVSGVQIVEQALGQLRSVQVGSTGATVTLDVAGKASPVHFEFSGLTKSLEGGQGGWLTLAAVPMLGAAAIRFLSFLAKLGAH